MPPAPASDRTLIRLLIVALAALVLVAALRGGVFGVVRPPGMVDRPCAAAPDIADMLRGDAERERLRDWGGLCTYAAANERLRKANRRPRVVMMGDSITAYWHDADPAFFGRNVAVSRGIPGQTSAQMLLRFEQDVVALRPRTVHILAGLNDVAGNTGPAGPEAFKANIRAMTAIARANGIAVVLGAMPPASGFYWRKGIDPRARITALNGWLRNYATLEGLVFVDYHAVLAGRGGYPRSAFSRDGVHPTAAAYAVMRPMAEAAFMVAETEDAGARSVMPATGVD